MDNVALLDSPLWHIEANGDIFAFHGLTHEEAHELAFEPSGFPCGCKIWSYLELPPRNLYKRWVLESKKAGTNKRESELRRKYMLESLRLLDSHLGTNYAEIS